jgi:hypothetical protein
MTDKILTEAYAKLTAIEENDTSDYASRHRKMQRAFADLKDDMTDKLQGLTDKLLRKMKLTDDGYVWGSAARPYKRGQGFMLSTRVSGDAQNIKAFVNRLNKEMGEDVDAIVVGSMHDTEYPPVAWIRAKFPNKYAKLTQIEESDEVPAGGDTVEHLMSGKIFYVESILDDGTYSLVDLETDDGIEVPRRGIAAYKIYEDKALELAKAAQKNQKNTFLGWYTTDPDGKGHIGSIEGKPKPETKKKLVDEDSADTSDGIDELQDIQAALFDIIDRLDGTIRDYVPDRYRYWRAYGLAHLKVIAGSDEYASDDESISTLINELESETEERAEAENRRRNR